MQLDPLSVMSEMDGWRDCEYAVSVKLNCCMIKLNGGLKERLSGPGCTRC